MHRFKYKRYRTRRWDTWQRLHFVFKELSKTKPSPAQRIFGAGALIALGMATLPMHAFQCVLQEKKSKTQKPHGKTQGHGQKLNAHVSKRCRCDLTRGTRGKALRQNAFKVFCLSGFVTLAAGGIAVSLVYFCAGPNRPLLIQNGRRLYE
jgi:hypothetical protein